MQSQSTKSGATNKLQKISEFPHCQSEINCYLYMVINIYLTRDYDNKNRNSETILSTRRDWEGNQNTLQVP